MTVQLPVLLWTVICFGALILILYFLLFKPMLSLMDRREERISRANEREEENRRALAEAQQALERFREEEKAHIDALSAKALSDAKTDADRLTADAAKENAALTERRREELKQESAEIRGVLDNNTEELARAWLSSLIS